MQVLGHADPIPNSGPVYIYFGDRGWWGKGGGYTSDIKQAQAMSYESAIKFCQSRYNSHIDNGVVCVPVHQNDVDRIMNK